MFIMLLFLFPTSAYATEVFRCGSEIVKIGDSSETVIKLCGKPGRSESLGSKSSQKKSKKSRIKTEDSAEPIITKGKKWYYDRGYGDYVYVLTFKANKLNKIQISERGGQ